VIVHFFRLKIQFGKLEKLKLSCFLNNEKDFLNLIFTMEYVVLLSLKIFKTILSILFMKKLGLIMVVALVRGTEQIVHINLPKICP